MTLQVVLNDPSLWSTSSNKKSYLAHFFLSRLFMNVHFIKKKLKETKNPEGYQDKVLEKETVSEAPVIISP